METTLRSTLRRELVAVYEALTQLVIGLPRAQPFLAAKRVLLRVLGASLGKRVVIYPGVWIMPISRRLVIGDDVDVARGALITTQGGVTIGSRTLVGYNVHILSSNHRVPDGFERIFDAGHTHASVNISNDVWIGAHAVILPGVNIGEGAVVAAGAIVTKSVPPYALVAGVPAAIVRSRVDGSL